jgi:membrane protease YdiL (CAAX protease family)
MMFMAPTYPPPPPRGQIGSRVPQRLGLWRGLGWAVAAQLAAYGVATLEGLALVAWYGVGPDRSISLTRNGHAAASLAVYVIGAATVYAVVVFACRRSGWRAVDYLAFTRPRGAFLCLGAVAVVVPFAASLAATLLTRGAGTPQTLDLAFAFTEVGAVVFSPMAEEILFRGFLFRALADTRIGVAGGIVLTSLVWGGLHQDYSSIEMVASRRWCRLRCTCSTICSWACSSCSTRGRLREDPRASPASRSRSRGHSNRSRQFFRGR